MQKLIFHPAWDKTIAEQDREYIQKKFETTHIVPEADIQFTSLKQAKNHRRELLVTVLIHNTSQREFNFHNQKMTYSINKSVMAKHTFTLPVGVEQKTSMPWTFIFPSDSFDDAESFKNGVLEITI